MATGWPVVVCFDTKNLKNIAGKIRGLCPDSVIIIAGDNDERPARRGHNAFERYANSNSGPETENPGKAAADIAASVCRGIAALPSRVGDWNDIHQAEGLEVVRTALEAARDRALRANPVPPGFSLERGAAELATVIETFIMDRAAPWMEGEPAPVGVARSTTGIGKSHLCRRYATELVKVTDKVVVIAVPMHKLSDEYAAAFEAEHGIRAAVWRGVDQVDPEGDGTEKMCLEPTLSEAAFSAGVSLSLVCQGCESRDRCGYKRQQKMTPKPKVWIVPHQMAFMPKPTGIGKVGLLIIDEDFRGAGVEDRGKPLSADSLDIKIGQSLSGADHDLVNMAQGVLLGAIRNSEDGPLTRSAIEGLDADIAGEAYRAAWADKPNPDIKGKSKAEVISALRGVAGQFNRRVPLIWKLVREFIESGDEASARIEVQSDLKTPGSDGRVRGVSMIFRKDIGRGWEVPTLLIDATARMEIINCFYPDAELLADINIRAPHQRNIRVDASFSKAMLLETETATERRNKSRRNNLDRVRRFIEFTAWRYAPARVAVICNQDVETLLAAGPPPRNVELSHFNNTRGLDAYRDVRALVSIGRTAANEFTTTRSARALTGRMDMPEVVEAVRWSICEGELLNGAIGRARGIRRTAENPVDVYLLNNLSLPIEIHETQTWDAAQPTAVELMAARGVIMDCPTETKGYWGVVAAVLPDLYPTSDAARMGAGRSREQTSINTILIDKRSRERWDRAKVRPVGGRYGVPIYLDPGKGALLRAVLDVEIERAGTGGVEPVPPAPCPVEQSPACEDPAAVNAGDDTRPAPRPASTAPRVVLTPKPFASHAPSLDSPDLDEWIRSGATSSGMKGRAVG